MTKKTTTRARSFTLKQAAARARKDAHVKSIEKRGYFMNSGILILPPNELTTWHEWILTFYNPEPNRVVKVTVKKGEKIIDVGKPSKVVKPTNAALDLKKLKTSAKRVMKKAIKEFEKFRQPVSQAIVTVHGDPPKWHINFITKALKIVIVEIDGKTGKILNSSVESLTRIENKGSAPPPPEVA